MQVAEILSDITSLRVCGHNEALALVSVNQTIPGTGADDKTPASEASGTDHTKKQEDLQRAKELVNLHYEVKSRHASGEVDEELRVSRENVDRVLRELS